MKINVFWGDLTNVSARKEALATVCSKTTVYYSVEYSPILLHVDTDLSDVYYVICFSSSLLSWIGTVNQYVGLGDTYMYHALLIRLELLRWSIDSSVIGNGKARIL